MEHWNAEGLTETGQAMASTEKLEDKIEQQQDQDENDIKGK